MVSISIANGQGLTQGLKAYAEAQGYDTSKISKQNWESTISRLEEIQASRAKNNQNSIYTDYANKSGWQGKMVVNQGNVEFSDAEVQSLFASMGLQTSAQGYENWTVAVDKTLASNPSALLTEKGQNKTVGTVKMFSYKQGDAASYFEQLGKFAGDYVAIMDENNDGKISKSEFFKYEEAQTRKEGTKPVNEQDLAQALKSAEVIFNRLNINDKSDSKDALDKTEIANFFFTMDKTPDGLAEGEISFDNYFSFMASISDEAKLDEKGNKSAGMLIVEFLNQGYNAVKKFIK